MATKYYGNSLSTAGQFPLDSKLRFKKLVDLKENITINSFKYYEDMIVQCLENHKQYIWREKLDTEQGVLPIDFIYPDNTIANGINYSNRTFNFYELKLGSDAKPCFKYKDRTLSMCNVQTKSNNITVFSNK